MKLAWKEIQFNFKKYILVEAILFLMIFMVLFLSGLANGLGRAVSAGIDLLPAQAFIISSDSEDIIPFSNFTDKAKEEIEDLNLTDLASLSIQRSAYSQDKGGDKSDITYFVIDPSQFTAPQVVEGQQIAKEGEIVLNSSFKEDGLAIGDTIYDASSEVALKIVGFSDGTYYGHSPIGYITPDSFSQIKQASIPNYEYSPQAYLSKDLLSQDLDDAMIVDKATIIENIPGYKEEQMTLQMIQWLLLVISAAILGVFFYILTLQRSQQFGVMKAIGMSMGELSLMQLCQVLLISLIGLGLGMAATFGMASVLPSSMPFYLENSRVFLIAGAFLVISLLASLASLGTVAKIDPAKIIGRSGD